MKFKLFLILVLFVSSCGPKANTDSLQGKKPETKEGELMKLVLCDLPPPEKLVPGEVDMNEIKTQLVGGGLKGWVHAAVKDQFLFVFTWRQPNNFFINVQLPMSSTDTKILESLSQLKRHDEIFIQGDFFKNESPLQHINVTSLEITKPYTGPGSDYVYESEVPLEIMNNNKMIAEVHIVTNGGAVLVVEYQDRILPVLVPRPEFTRQLYRGDKIELSYLVKTALNRPPHLILNTNSPEPIRMIEQIACGHNEPIELEGSLVMFPQSPQIMFNVFALRTRDAEGIEREYTLVNFENSTLFTEIRRRLQGSWDIMSEYARNDRNKLLNERILVKVKGIKNVMAGDQANPQILINDIKDLKIELF